jgi:hemolysin III
MGAAASTAEAVTSREEEVANACSHGIGFLAVLGATPLLVGQAVRHGSPQDVLGVTIYAASAALLYLASTIYHAAPVEARAPLRLMDHLAIYLLIAGTYTPFALGPLGGRQGWEIFALMWALALGGVLFKCFAPCRFGYVSTALYCAMGWMGLFLIRPLVLQVGPGVVTWLLAGGAAYTLGLIFYHWERLRYSHFIWHLFVLAGSACHFVAILRYAT